MVVEDRRTKAIEDLRWLGWTTLGLLGAVALAVAATNYGGWLGTFGLGMTIVLSAFMIGTLLGFLFAVPRVLAQSAPVPRTDAVGEDASDTKRRFLQTNTNLERISDWLTTMLVGVGLSQIGNINEALLAFRKYVAEYNCTTTCQSNALAIASPFCLLFGLIAGFLAMYLYTRIFIAGILSRVEIGLGDIQAPLPEPDQKVVATVAKEAQAAGVSSRAIDDAADPTTPVSAEDSVSVMFDLLYEPEGYKRVIDIGERLAASPASSMATYWYYLAAAYGQQMAAAQAADDSELAEQSRSKALEAAEQAIRISPSYRNRLWYISNPNGIDNDLAPLRNDKAFKKLVRR
jgi:hypothetical protein